MSDDISIPRPALSNTAPGRISFTHSYRSRRTGMDRGTKVLLLAASALGTMLLGGMAIWSFTGHKAAGVPTIEADNRPVRIKPENAGGMTAIGVGDPAGAVGNGMGDLAPAAEQPDPQALLAQRRAAAAPKITSTPPLPSPAAAPPLPTAAAPIQAPPAPTPAPAPAPAPAPSSDIAARPASANASGTMVQLAAVDSETGATAEWQRLSRKLPDLLGDRHPAVQRTEQGGKSFWRLRTGGFADVAEATQFCKRVRAKGVGCSLANF